MSKSLLTLLASALFLWIQIEGIVYLNVTADWDPHDFYYGAKGDYDGLLSRKVLYKRGASFLGVGLIITDQYTFPPAGTTTKVPISGVRVYDKAVDGTGGYVNRMVLGPENRTVTFTIQTQRGQGYNFIFDVFGAF